MSAWPAESAQSGFDTDVAGQAVTALEVEQMLAAAEQVARLANPAALLGCDPAAIGEEACGRAFIDRFAARAFRRPPTADVKARLAAVLDHGRRVAGFAHGVRLVIEAVLQSPHFLYRVELGEPAMAGAARVPLTGPEVAARLSFFLTGTLPDEALRAAADGGALRTTAGIEQQARRLLAKPRCGPSSPASTTSGWSSSASRGSARTPSSILATAAEWRRRWRRAPPRWRSTSIWTAPTGRWPSCSPRRTRSWTRPAPGRTA